MVPDKVRTNVSCMSTILRRQIRMEVFPSAARRRGCDGRESLVAILSPSYFHLFCPFRRPNHLMTIDKLISGDGASRPKSSRTSLARGSFPTQRGHIGAINYDWRTRPPRSDARQTDIAAANYRIRLRISRAGFKGGQGVSHQTVHILSR